jgi:hypothetical protein
MYGCQVWGTAFLESARLSSPPQAIMNSFIKSILGVRQSVANDAAMHELCQVPLQFYWLRSVCRFWNRFEKANNRLLEKVAKQDALLARQVPGCWSAQLNKALDSLGIAKVTERMVGIDLGATCAAWHKTWQDRWLRLIGNDPRHVDCEHRQQSTYAAYCKVGEGVKLSQLPWYLRARRIPDEVRHTFARFRLGNHGLGVEQGAFNRIPFEQRFCGRCMAGHNTGLIDDGWHLVFECVTTASLRDDYKADLEYSNTDLRCFCERACAPFYIHSAFRLINPMLDAEALNEPQHGPAA